MVSKKSITIPVRIDPETDARIKRAARRLRTSSASVVRFAVDAHLTAVEAGTIRLPHPARIEAAR